MKKILINGTHRSGTTFLMVQAKKNGYKILYEPISNYPEVLAYIRRKKLTATVHSYFSSKEKELLFTDYLEINNLEEIIIKYHPNISNRRVYIYDIEKLKKYLLFFKDFSIKEIGLHFYLTEDFIKNNWDVYHIIRHPIDILCDIYSILRPPKRLKKFILEYFGILFIATNLRPMFNNFYNARELATLYDINERTITRLSKALVLEWTITNYYVVQRLPKEKIIIYEKPETYKRLPFELKDPLRIKIYEKEREKLQYKFEKYAKEFGIEEEYNYLLKLFG